MPPFFRLPLRTAVPFKLILTEAWQRSRQVSRHLVSRGPALAVAPLVSGVMLGVSSTGWFQLLDWAAYDWFMRTRPATRLASPLVLVTIREADIAQNAQWPMPDRVLAQLLQKIKQAQPRVIGLDLYRDFPVEPGKAELEQVLRSTPNLIGIEKGVGTDLVPPPPLLAANGQVSLADLILDEDGKVRRGLIYITDPHGQTQLGLAAKLAMSYLQTEGIHPSFEGEQLHWGKARIAPLSPSDGGYVNSDTGGYQVLLNYRASRDALPSVSMMQVLNGQVSPDLFRDRIVLIGSEAISLNDFFITPYDFLLTPQSRENRTPGVFIHAQLTNQLIAASRGDTGAMLKVLPEGVEWLWTLFWGMVGGGLSWRLLQPQLHRRQTFPTLTRTVALVAVGGSVLVLHYGLFVAGWWVPVVAPLLSLWGAALISMVYHNQRLQKMVSSDHLTQVANRRYFDLYLAQQFEADRPLSLVLCDVDYFKKYNDTYGHQAGDDCLQRVAAAIRQASRQIDLVARYGGEEFAVVLPNTSSDAAIQVAERIRLQVTALKLPHQASEVQAYITLSCGVVSSAHPNRITPAELITRADQALYQAKATGRDRIVTSYLS